MMNKTLLAILVFILIPFIGCTGSGVSEAPEAVANKAAPEESAHDNRVVKLPIDMDEEQRLQKAVDNGGQTWRNDAVEVAHAVLVNQGVNVKPGDCELTAEDGEQAVVKVIGPEHDFKVHVERLVRAEGIWTATEIDIFERSE